MTPAIRLLLADDHALMRAGVRASLALYPRIQIVAEASDGEEALRKAHKMRPDVALLDVTMPKMGGFEVARRLRAELPGVLTVLLTMHQDAEYLRQISPSGAKGYVLKDAPPAELVAAIEAAFRGRVFLSPAVRQAMDEDALERDRPGGAGLEALTPRERQVLTLVAGGLSNRAVAAKLAISVRTVESHRDRVMRKLDVHNVAALTKLAIAHGLVHLK